MGKVTNHKHGDINVPVLLGLDAGVVRVLQLTAEPESRAVCVRPLVIGLKKIGRLYRDHGFSFISGKDCTRVCLPV